MELTKDELEHLFMALLAYNGELSRDSMIMVQSDENIAYIERQQEINLSLAQRISDLRYKGE